MIGCHLTDLAQETLADAPIIVISGAHEVSTSTLMEQLIAGRDVRIINLDIIVEDRRREVVGVEVKATSNPRGTDFRGLEYLRDKLGRRFKAGILLHTGTRSLPFGDRLWALPISVLWDH